MKYTELYKIARQFYKQANSSNFDYDEDSDDRSEWEGPPGTWDQHLSEQEKEDMMLDRRLEELNPEPYFDEDSKSETEYDFFRKLDLWKNTIIGKNPSYDKLRKLHDELSLKISLYDESKIPLMLQRQLSAVESALERGPKWMV